jgi:hypothetical protein
VAEIQRSCRGIELGRQRIDEILDDQLVPADAPLRLKRRRTVRFRRYRRR